MSDIFGISQTLRVTSSVLERILGKTDDAILFLARFFIPLVQGESPSPSDGPLTFGTCTRTPTQAVSSSTAESGSSEADGISTSPASRSSCPCFGAAGPFRKTRSTSRSPACVFIVISFVPLLVCLFVLALVPDNGHTNTCFATWFQPLACGIGAAHCSDPIDWKTMYCLPGCEQYVSGAVYGGGVMVEQRGSSSSGGPEDSGVGPGGGDDATGRRSLAGEAEGRAGRARLHEEIDISEGETIDVSNIFRLSKDGTHARVRSGRFITAGGLRRPQAKAPPAPRHDEAHDEEQEELAVALATEEQVQPLSRDEEQEDLPSSRLLSSSTSGHQSPPPQAPTPSDSAVFPRRYAALSYLCPAAVHAGIVSDDSGGCFRYRVVPSPNSYASVAGGVGGSASSREVGFFPVGVDVDTCVVGDRDGVLVTQVDVFRVVSSLMFVVELVALLLYAVVEQPQPPPAGRESSLSHSHDGGLLKAGALDGHDRFFLLTVLTGTLHVLFFARVQSSLKWGFVRLLSNVAPVLAILFCGFSLFGRGVFRPHGGQGHTRPGVLLLHTVKQRIFFVVPFLVLCAYFPALDKDIALGSLTSDFAATIEEKKQMGSSYALLVALLIFVGILAVLQGWNWFRAVGGCRRCCGGRGGGRGRTDAQEEAGGDNCDLPVQHRGTLAQAHPVLHGKITVTSTGSGSDSEEQVAAGAACSSVVGWGSRSQNGGTTSTTSRDDTSTTTITSQTEEASISPARGTTWSRSRPHSRSTTTRTLLSRVVLFYVLLIVFWLLVYSAIAPDYDFHLHHVSLGLLLLPLTQLASRTSAVIFGLGCGLFVDGFLTWGLVPNGALAVGQYRPPSLESDIRIGWSDDVVSGGESSGTPGSGSSSYQGAADGLSAIGSSNSTASSACPTASSSGMPRKPSGTVNGTSAALSNTTDTLEEVVVDIISNASVVSSNSTPVLNSSTSIPPTQQNSQLNSSASIPPTQQNSQLNSSASIPPSTNGRRSTPPDLMLITLGAREPDDEASGNRWEFVYIFKNSVWQGGIPIPAVGASREERSVLLPLEGLEVGARPLQQWITVVYVEMMNARNSGSNPTLSRSSEPAFFRPVVP